MSVSSRAALAGWRDLWLVPAVLAMLPRRLRHRAIVALARRPREPGPPAPAACAAAQRRLPHGVAAPQAWQGDFRYVQWQDRIDAWLAMAPRRLRAPDPFTTAGDPWPQGPCIALSFHFGAGLLALRALADAGPPVHFLSLRLERARFPGSSAYWLAARLRARQIERAGRAALIETGGARRRIAEALRGGHSVCALLDVPDAPDPLADQPLLGQPTRWPVALLELAAELAVPVVVFVASVDAADGSRWLHRRVLDPRAGTAHNLAQAVASLADALARQSYAWHLWSRYDAQWPAPPATGAAIAPARPD